MEIGDEEEILKINEKQPKQVKKKRKIKLNDDEEEDMGYEEYYDYIFPEENTQQKNLKMLQKAAMMWKQRQEEA